MVHYVIVRHRVKEYESWKKGFDASEDLRWQYGLRGGDICRDVDDPSMITVSLECESLERAREFSTSQELRKAMERAGVISEPVILFVEQLAVVPQLSEAHPD